MRTASTKAVVGISALPYPVRSSHLDSVRTVLIALPPPRAALVLPPCQPLLMAWSPGAAALGSAGMISSRSVNPGEAGVRASVHVVLVWG